MKNSCRQHVYVYFFHKTSPSLIFVIAYIITDYWQKVNRETNKHLDLFI